MTLAEVLKVRRYKAGYEVRTERHSVGDDEQEVTLRSAYTPNGDYIGDPKMARSLVVKWGIRPEKASPDHNICSIGFCKREQRWYGWSHRAMCGFGIGDVIEKGDVAASPSWTEEYLAEHPEADLSLPVGFKAETLEDCRRMAVAFAAAIA